MIPVHYIHCTWDDLAWLINVFCACIIQKRLRLRMQIDVFCTVTPILGTENICLKYAI